MKTQQEIAEYWYNAYEDPRNDELSVYDAIDNALAEYAQQIEQPWVRVEPGCEMPKDSSDILFVVGVMYSHKPMVVQGYYHKGKWISIRDGIAYEATHWMPLPAPPKD